MTDTDAVKMFTADAAVHVQPSVVPQWVGPGLLYVLIADGHQVSHLYLPLDVAERLATQLAVRVAEAKAEQVA